MAINTQGAEDMENEYTKGLTTQELLQWLKDCVDHYSHKYSRHATKEEYKFKYEVAKSVSETLSLNEIMLIYYLRNSEFGLTYRFMKIAEKLYEANQELKDVKHNIDMYE